MKLSTIMQKIVNESVKRGYDCKQFVKYFHIEKQRRQHMNGEHLEFDFETACEIDISKLLLPKDGCDGCMIGKTCSKHKEDLK